MIDNVEMSLAKTDRRIAERYLALGDRDDLAELVLDEMELTPSGCSRSPARSGCSSSRPVLRPGGAAAQPLRRRALAAAAAGAARPARRRVDDADDAELRAPAAAHASTASRPACRTPAEVSPHFRPPRRSRRSRVQSLARIYTGGYIRRMVASAVWEAIAEPTRRRILEAVRTGERSVNELVDLVGMNQPGVSRHLRVLRDSGLVTVRSDAQRRLYRLRSEPLRDLDEWLGPYRAEWSTRLDALEQHLDRTARHASSQTLRTEDS